MIVMDRPRRLPDGRITAHLLSDLDGDAAYRELLPVALALGCHPVFYQYPGRYKAHFDLIGPRRINAALAHPAITTVPRRQIAEILRRRKRHEMGR
ncbi:MAG: hypothetical protein P1U65_11495 [Minwuia sp.]|nr:hypothetical protein [Minwuia sp.]